MKLEIGDRFLHAKEWDRATGEPKRCVVIQVTADQVYWRADDRRSTTGKVKRWFPIADTALHVKKVLPFGSVI